MATAANIRAAVAAEEQTSDDAAALAAIRLQSAKAATQRDNAYYVDRTGYLRDASVLPVGYASYTGYLDSASVLPAGYASLTGYIAAASALSAGYANHIGYLDSVSAILAYTQRIGYLQGASALPTGWLDAYSHLRGTASLPSGYIDKTGFLRATSALPLGYIGFIGYLDGASVLPVYVQQTGYIDGASALPAGYVDRTGYLDSASALLVYVPTYGWLDSTSALLAAKRFYYWAINLETGAASRWEGLPGINSWFVHDGVLHGIGTGGIYAMNGAKDGVTPINAFIDFGKTDFGTSQLKRLTDAYVSADCDGKMRLTITPDSGAATKYVITEKGGPRNKKLNLARGVKSRYFRVKLENVTGTEFAMDEVELLPEVLGRRK